MDFLHRTWAEIDTKALVHNLKIFKEKLGDTKFMAVVKADAYGHSAKDLCPILDQNGVDWFAVSNINEALTLRENGIQKPILILGYTPVDMVRELEKNNIDFLLNKGVVLMELGKFEEAVDSFNKVLLRSPDNEDAFFLKEECLEYF